MGVGDGASEWHAILVFVSKRRDDDLADCVVEVVAVVAGLAVGFAVVAAEPPTVRRLCEKLNS